MRTVDALFTVVSVVALTGVVVSFTGCGEKIKTAGTPDSRIVATSRPGSGEGGVVSRSRRSDRPGETPVASAPTVDPRVIMSGFQRQVLDPAGVPLTDEQQKRIIETFDPSAPGDMRPIFGVMTREQKQAVVSKLRADLANSAHPLTDSQAKRIMAIGLSSTEKSWLEVLTPEQLRVGVPRDTVR